MGEETMNNSANSSANKTPNFKFDSSLHKLFFNCNLLVNFNINFSK
jgi:hypothetical protein